MKGKLLVIDGLDGSGKSTQAELLATRLRKEGRRVELISYPDYEKTSSTLVRMYLNGEFSEDVSAVNAYAASTFYAVDRYAGFMQHWGKLYQEGALIIASRYVSSNAIHQMVKLPKNEWMGFLTWLSDYEYQKLGLPKPDCICFLDMSRQVADKLISSRYQGDEKKRDIHERDMSYLQDCMESAAFAANKEHWTVLRCCDGQNPYSVENIAEELYRTASGMLNDVGEI